MILEDRRQLAACHSSAKTRQSRSHRRTANGPGLQNFEDTQLLTTKKEDQKTRCELAKSCDRAVGDFLPDEEGVMIR